MRCQDYGLEDVCDDMVNMTKDVPELKEIGIGV